MLPNPQETAELVSYTEEIPNGKVEGMKACKFIN